MYFAMQFSWRVRHHRSSFVPLVNCGLPGSVFTEGKCLLAFVCKLRPPLTSNVLLPLFVMFAIWVFCSDALASFLLVSRDPMFVH